MARGFESKAVSDQQEEAQRDTPAREDVPRDPVAERTRRTLELALVDVRRRLAGAPAVLRPSLQAALDDLERKLANFARD